MAVGDSLYDLLSVLALVVDRVAKEIIDARLEPVAANVERAGAWLQQIEALQADVVGAFPGVVPSLPDVFYAQRLIRLVKLGQLDAQSDLQRMRYGEVRRPR